MDVTAIMEKSGKNTGGVAVSQKMQKNLKIAYPIPYKKRCVTLHLQKMNAQALKCVCAFFVLAMPFVNYIYNVFNLLLRHARTDRQTQFAIRNHLRDGQRQLRNIP